MLSPQSISIEPLHRDRITAISAAVQRRPIVLVVGMHRSGTSLTSHLLSALGIDMADKIPGPGATSPHPSNPRGHWERWEIVEFHDRILSLFNRDFLGHFHDFALPVAWWADPCVAQIRREIVAFLEERMGDGYFGFKDPRTIRLMPVWHQIFNELKLAPKLVLCLRNPAQVARSLHARDGLDPANGEYRWLVHMIDFFRYASNFDCCTVEYEDWFDNPALNVEKLRRFFDLPWQQSEADLGLVVSGIIDPSARHDDPSRPEASQPLVRSLYKLAVQVGQDAAARDEIAYIVSQFVSFQQLQRPLEQAFEDVAKVAAKYPAIEQETVALRALVAERQAALRHAEREAQERSAATLARESEIVVLRDALARLERAEQERMAAAAAQQAETAALWDTLVQAEQERQQSEAAATVMQSEIATLRNTLAQAEREARQHVAATKALEAELRGLRERSLQAEREAIERSTAVAALQAEIANLQGTLTAAREVGKAAVAAFRLDIAAPATSNARRGWFQTAMKFLCARRST